MVDNFQRLRKFLEHNQQSSASLCVQVYGAYNEILSVWPTTESCRVKQLDIGPANKAPLGRSTFVQAKAEEEATGKSAAGVKSAENRYASDVNRPKSATDSHDHKWLYVAGYVLVAD